mgnify:FL=1
MEFEDLKDSLDTVFGSMKAGDAAMKRVFDFAATTPFQVETATKAFIALKSVGIEPTNKMLQTFADTASVSVDQLGVFEALVRTVQRSAAGGLGLEELNMLSDRGIPALKILSEELGLTKDDIAKFGKTVEGAKLITDALQEGLDKRFGGAMENKMDNLSTKTSNMTIAFKQLADEVFQSGLGKFFGNMADTLREAAESAVRASQAIRGVGTGVKLLTPQFGERMNPQQKLNVEKETIKKNIELLNAAKDPLVARHLANQGQNRTGDGVTGAVEAIGAAAGNLSGEQVLLPLSPEEESRLDTILEKIRELDAEYMHLVVTNGKLTQTQKDDLMRQGELQNSLTFITGLLKKDIGASQQLAFARDNLTEIYSQNEEALLRLGFTQKQIETLLDEEIKKLGEVNDAFGELGPVIAEATNQFTNDFVQSLMDGENAMDSFKNLFKDMARQIIASALQMQIIKPIMDAMFTAVGLPVSAKAGGGRVQKGMPTLVGERGAEIFVPNTGGTIMNNMNSKNALSGGGGVTVVQNNNFALGVGATARAEVAKLLPQIQESSKAAVLEAAARGGSFRRGLMGG